MNQHEENFHTNEERLKVYKERFNFLRITLESQYMQLYMSGRLTPYLQQRYQDLAAKMNLDEELLEQEFFDILDGKLEELGKEVQGFINVANQ
jgi:hypothetical protein